MQVIGPEVADDSKVILIIDDEPSIMELAVDLLGSEGYRAYGADSGPEALTLLGKIPCPNLIMVDCLMPMMSGEDFILAVRKQYPACAEKTRFIGMSALPSDSTIKEGFDSLIYAFESKPDDLDKWIQIAKKYSL